MTTIAAKNDGDKIVLGAEFQPEYVVLCACNEGMAFEARINKKQPGSNLPGKVDIWSCENCENLISVQFFKEEVANEN